MKRRTILGAGLAAVVLPARSWAAPDVADRLADGQPTLVIAHRSVRFAGFPEQSLAGIDHAIGLGIEMLHINPQITRDGRYVVMHDPTLNRTTDVEVVFPQGAPGGPDRQSRGGQDFVGDYTLDQIRQLRLTDGTDGGRHPVPTLDEAMDLADGRIMLLLGLKNYDTEGLAAVLNARDRRGLMLFDLLYSDPALMHGMTMATGIGAAVSLTESRTFATYAKALAALERGLGPALDMVVVDSRKLSAEVTERTRATGVRICLSGRSGPEDSALEFRQDPGPWKAALAGPAAAVLTTHPEEVLALTR